MCYLRIEPAVNTLAEAKGLYFQHLNSQNTIIANLSFSIASGERIALLGASGSGKTTIMKLLARYIRPTSGQLFFSEKIAFGSCTPHGIGYLPQNSMEVILPWRTVEDNLRIAIELRSTEKFFCVREMLDLLGLLHRRTAFPLRLSGGERRRLALGMVLGTASSLMLLDEPFTGVDLDLRLRLWDWVSSTLATVNNAALLLVTHHIEEAALLCYEAHCLRASPEGATFSRSKPLARGDYPGPWTDLPSRAYRQRDGLVPYLKALDDEFYHAIQTKA